MNSNKLAVLSTLSAHGWPQSAVVGFSAHKGCVLVMGTSSLSRKFHNLERDPHVSVVVGWDQGKTVQFEGIARILSKEEEGQWTEQHYKIRPEALKYNSDPNERHFIVRPTWIRYTDLTKSPWEIHEKHFPELQEA